MEERGIKKPTLVKWAGGKKQLLEQFKPLFPNQIIRYFEPFVGGGAVAFYLLKTHPEIKKIYLSDINKELIITYNVVKKNLNELILSLKKHERNHKRNPKKYYYKIRDLVLKKDDYVEIASRFIYLNKTCFNGIYRVNKNGKFNVPIGRYKNPGICQEKDLQEISNLLKKDDVKCSQFSKILEKAKKGDFIYFDPPYYPLDGKPSFTAYTKNNFLEEDHRELAKIFRELDKRGCEVMLSNSNSNFIKELYKGYDIRVVHATRMINCDSTKRGKIKEIVIRNYS
jgi:DNA adenine methylase|tara:strand:+ start:297 stop:1145 length:849 start_codon:yes stop_codon:yes gene_type:complete